MEKEWKRNGKGMEKECVAGADYLIVTMVTAGSPTV